MRPFSSLEYRGHRPHRTGPGCGKARLVLPAVSILFLLLPRPAPGMDEVATPPSWPMGAWRVVEVGFGLDCRLSRLVIEPQKTGRGIWLSAFEASSPAGDRPWGSATLRSVDPGNAFEAEWTAANASLRLRIRPEPDGRMSGLVRERDRNRPWLAAERVRQLILAPEQGVARPVTLDREPRAAPGARAPRTDLALLYVAQKDGSNLRIVVRPDGFARAGYPAWSPDGQNIAFTAFDSSGRDPLIRVVNVKGGPAIAVAAGIAPNWSHDGSRLAYVASGKPDFATDWSVPGRNEERIEAVSLKGPRAGDLEVLARGIWPRWSPVDDRLAFVARLDANWDVYVRSADGTRLSRLTDDPSNDTYPMWVRDGSAVIFLSNRLNRWDLFKVALGADRTLTQLTNHRRREDQPDVSPDGTEVVFTDGLGRPDSQVLILDLASGAVRPLTAGARGDRDPAWSPDGRWVAFISRRPSPLLPVTGAQP